jgi:hypothetical protein
MYGVNNRGPVLKRVHPLRLTLNSTIDEDEDENEPEQEEILGIPNVRDRATDLLLVQCINLLHSVASSLEDVLGRFVPIL